MVMVNGKEQGLSEEILVSELLELMGYQADRVAVEHNGRMVSRSRLSETTIRDGDILEVISFVGGG
ncbi:sulfur carrier protein ThiS [Lacrimispora indolis]|uniref:sulfur carrier protein ThiS n=1 Tax=Lacrimispora indolis TaxID=69825 RepID=UPI000410332F|nr:MULTISPECIES: sulfur carrier protein ThiS [Lachnospiraceae]MBE7720159.1 sulfur carrier protein ThiS [Lacrimispora celerecrescens]